MQFKKLVIKNFMSVGNDAVEIDFSEFGDNNIIRINGENKDISDDSKNGCGKSLIAEAIIYALFDKTIRGIGKEECINNITKKKLEVSLIVDDYKIIRTRKPNGVEFYKDDTGRFLDVFVIERLTQSTVALTQQAIEDKLGVNFETFLSIFYFGQHNLNSFISADAATKRSIIETLLQLNKFNELEKKSKEVNLNLKRKIKDLMEQFAVDKGIFSAKVDQLKVYQAKSLQYEQDINNTIFSLIEKIDIIKSIDIDAINQLWEKYEQSQLLKTKILEEINKVKDKINALNEEFQVNTSSIRNDIDEINKQISLNDKTKEINDKYLKQEQDLNNTLVNMKVEVAKGNSLLLMETKHNGVILPLEHKNVVIDNDLNRLEREKDAFGVYKPGTICPSCNQVITEEHFNKALNEVIAKIEPLRSEKEVNTAKIKELKDAMHAEIAIETKRIEEKKAKIQELETNIKSVLALKQEEIRVQNEALLVFKVKIEESMKSLSVIESEHEKKKAEFNASISNYSCVVGQCDLVLKPSISKEDIMQKQVELSSYMKKIEEKKDEINNNPYTEIISNYTKESVEAEEKFNNTQSKVRETEELMPYYEFWVKSFTEKGLKSFIIDQIIPTLNKQINYWLGFFIHNKITVNFDKYLNISIQRNNGAEEFTYDQSSGGEKKRIDLAIMLAFAYIMQIRSGINSNIIFLDEVAESIDIDGVNGIYEALLELAYNKNVFVITHREDLISKMTGAKVINMVKQNGFSHVEY